MCLSKLRHAILGLVIFLFADYSGAAQAYNRNWWLSSSKQERTEFLAGYSDCSFYDARQGYWKSVSWTLLENQIGNYFSSHNSASASLFATIERFAKEQKRADTRTGEDYPEKHGIFDGGYWFEATPSGRRGFVEGYEACQENKIPGSQTLHFEPNEQVQMIDRWYGLSDRDHGSIRSDRANTKIADIIARLEK